MVSLNHISVYPLALYSIVARNFIKNCILEELANTPNNETRTEFDSQIYKKCIHKIFVLETSPFAAEISSQKKGNLTQAAIDIEEILRDLDSINDMKAPSQIEDISLGTNKNNSNNSDIIISDNPSLFTSDMRVLPQIEDIGSETSIYFDSSNKISNGKSTIFKRAIEILQNNNKFSKRNSTPFLPSFCESLISDYPFDYINVDVKSLKTCLATILSTDQPSVDNQNDSVSIDETEKSQTYSSDSHLNSLSKRDGETLINLKVFKQLGNDLIFILNDKRRPPIVITGSHKKRSENGDDATFENEIDISEQGTSSNPAIFPFSYTYFKKLKSPNENTYSYIENENSNLDSLSFQKRDIPPQGNAGRTRNCFLSPISCMYKYNVNSGNSSAILKPKQVKAVSSKEAEKLLLADNILEYSKKFLMENPSRTGGELEERVKELEMLEEIERENLERRSKKEIQEKQTKQKKRSLDTTLPQNYREFSIEFNSDGISTIGKRDSNEKDVNGFVEEYIDSFKDFIMENVIQAKYYLFPAIYSEDSNTTSVDILSSVSSDFISSLEDFLDFILKTHRIISKSLFPRQLDDVDIDQLKEQYNCNSLISQRDVDDKCEVLKWYEKFYMDMNDYYQANRDFAQKYKKFAKRSVLESDVNDNIEESKEKTSLFKDMKKLSNSTSDNDEAPGLRPCGYSDALSYMYKRMGNRFQQQMPSGIPEQYKNVSLDNAGQLIDAMRNQLQSKVKNILNGETPNSNATSEDVQMAAFMFYTVAKVSSRMQLNSFPDYDSGCLESFTGDTGNGYIAIDSVPITPKSSSKKNTSKLEEREFNESLLDSSLLKNNGQNEFSKKNEKILPRIKKLFSRFITADKGQTDITTSTLQSTEEHSNRFFLRRLEENGHLIKRSMYDNVSLSSNISEVSQTNSVSSFWNHLRYSADLNKKVSLAAWSIATSVCLAVSLPVCVGFLIVPLFFSVFGGVYFDPTANNGNNNNNNTIIPVIEGDAFNNIEEHEFLWSDFNDEMKEVFVNSVQSKFAVEDCALTKLPNEKSKIQVSSRNGISRFSIDGSALLLKEQDTLNEDSKLLRSVELYIKNDNIFKIPREELIRISYSISELANKERFGSSCISIKDDKGNFIHGELAFNGGEHWNFRNECLLV